MCCAGEGRCEGEEGAGEGEAGDVRQAEAGKEDGTGKVQGKGEAEVDYSGP